METSSKQICIYSGSEITVSLLKSELDEAGILNTMHNEFDQGVAAGFSAGTPYCVDLYILDTDLAQAEPIVEAFKKINAM
jgi:hypothetical protein